MKPDVTMKPSKAVLTQAAAQIYAAYVATGRVGDTDTENWIKRSILEAITIARTVNVSVYSDNELAAEESDVVSRS